MQSSVVVGWEGGWGDESVLSAHANLELRRGTASHHQLCKHPKPHEAPENGPPLHPSVSGPRQKKQTKKKRKTVTSSTNTVHTLRLKRMPLCVTDETQTRLQPLFLFMVPFYRPFGIMHESCYENDKWTFSYGSAANF